MTTQEKFDQLVQQLTVNGQLSDTLAQDLPLGFMAIRGEEERQVLAETFRKFQTMWHNHPEVQMLWRYLSTLLERDSTRAALMEAHQLGRLQKLAELE